MFRLKSKRQSRKSFLWIVFMLVAAFGLWGLFLRYQQSSVFMSEGDVLIKNGKPEEAAILYQKAHDVFPFRPDVLDSLKGARIKIESETLYGKIYQISTQIQEVPPAVVEEVAKEGELRVPILMYHHIRVNPRPSDPVWAALNVTPQQLDDQISYLLGHNFHPITLDELWGALTEHKPLPPNPIVLTFDDGYKSLYENAFPVIRKYRVKIVAFVITRVVGSSAYLSWDEIAQLDKSGLVEFAAHTQHHPNLPDLSLRIATDEIVGSKKDLESHLSKPIHWFAYPYGSYTKPIIDIVQKAGFTGAVSTIYGSIQSPSRRYLMPRIMVDGRYDLDAVARRITY